MTRAGSGVGSPAGRTVLLRRAVLALAGLLTALPAQAAGARYVTGPPFFTGSPGQPVVWRQSTLLYSTDPGSLSATVDHQAADALVAAAAATWNVPVANITLAQGGSLAEHVSGLNTYLSPAGMVYPADVAPGNAASVPIAVVYDTNGSITDLLLGSGASSPSSCHQNAVTESVDRFDPAGYILHAVVVLNGRCTGAAPAAQQEIRYKLERAFGRVLGLAWSQTNDNVFTGMPQPTYAQAMHWPILHPIDILCGPYSYQCLPSPFTLRDDDLAGLVELYPVLPGQAAPGKQVSLENATSASGTIQFPTGQGMAGVNVLYRRRYLNSLNKEAWFETSAVSGQAFRRAGVSPFVAAGTDAAASMGFESNDYMGFYQVGYIPTLPGSQFNSLEVSTEAVNPLYMGGYSLGPYGLGTVQPSGTAPAPYLVPQVGADARVYTPITVTDAAVACGSGTDGTPAVPAAVDPSGWWNGVLCGYGHAAFGALTVRAGRSFTLEVTALDEAGAPTVTKAMPVLGVYGPGDSALPTVAVAAAAFQSRAAATTGLTLSLPAATASPSTALRLGIADERGDGRPDFLYSARLLYADAVTPARLPAAGGTVTLTGMGFRSGNTVTVNGVAAAVLSWSANTIVAMLPPLSAANAQAESALDLVVTDQVTGGTTTLTGALTYGLAPSPARVMKLLTAPAGDVYVGDVASQPFAVQMLAADGVTPVAGEAVTLSASGGAATLAACTAPVCNLRSDAGGVVSTTVTPITAGAVALRAVDGSLTQTAGFKALVQAGSIQVLLGPAAVAAVNDTGSPQPLIVQVLDAAGRPMPNRLVRFTTPVGAAIFSTCSAASCALVTNDGGVAVITFVAAQVGPLTVRIADGGVFAEVSLTATDNTDEMQIVQAPPPTSLLGTGASFTVRLLRHGGAYGDGDKPVTFSAPDGVLFPLCGSNTCTIRSGGDGIAAALLDVRRAGTYTVGAAFGQVMQTVTFTVTAGSLSLHILQAPSGTVPLGIVTSTPFTVQALDVDGVTPLAGKRLAMGGEPGSVVLGLCNSAYCSLVTDGNGIVSTDILPIRPGQIVLNAVLPESTVTASFNVAGSSEVLRIVEQPGPGGVAVGVPTRLTAQLLHGDGTPFLGAFIAFQTTGGAFEVGNCGYSICGLGVDAQGMVSMSGFGLAPGPVTLAVSTNAVPITQTITFPVTASGPSMRLLESPTGTVPVGTAAASPMRVQMLDASGTRPLQGERVTFSVTGGSARLGACEAGVCTVVTDASGQAATTVTPAGPGPIVLVASDGAANQTATLTGKALPDRLIVLGSPASGGFTGVAAPQSFRVQVLLADGSAAVGRQVTMAVTAGYAALAACGGGASCVLTADTQGIVSSAVTPQAESPVTLTVTDEGVTASATFTPVAAPDTMQVVSAPADGSFVDSVAAAPFTVRLVGGDGVTPLRGRAVVFNSAQAVFAACGGGSCTVFSGQDGTASSAITPLAAGQVTLSATLGGLSQAASFMAQARPDTMRLVGAPADGSPVGSPALAPFSVKLLHADGSAASGQMVTFTVTRGGAAFDACGGPVCMLGTDASGVAAVSVRPAMAGVIELRAAVGQLAVTASFAAVQPADTLRAVAQPADGALTGQVAAIPFTVQLANTDPGRELAGRSLTFSVTSGTATLAACGKPSCVLFTDARGLASTGVIPGAAGTVAISVAETTDPGISASISFRADAPPDRLTVSTALPGFVYVGDTTAFTVQARLADGTTALPGRSVQVSAAGAGPVTLLPCGAALCMVTTDAAGVATVNVRADAAGSFTLQAVETGSPGSNTVTGSTVARLRPDVLSLVSAPASVRAGQTAATQFSVRLMKGDAATAVAGTAITLSAAGAGTAVLEACPSQPCVLRTDGAGMITTTVTGVSPGAVTLAALPDSESGASSVSALLTVEPETRTVTGVQATLYTAAGVPVRRRLEVSVLRNGAAAAGETVHWSAGRAASVDQADTLVDSAGIASVQAGFGPLAGGVASTVSACAWSTVCHPFAAVGVAEPAWRVELVAGQSQEIAGTVYLPVVARVTDGQGHGVAGAPVHVYQTVTAQQACPAYGRCPAAPVLATDVRALTSAEDGTVTIAPLTVDDQPSATRILFSSGSNGAATVVLTRLP